MQRVLQNLRPGDDVGGMFAHQSIIAGDIRFAFRTVDQQRVDGAIGAGIEFDETRETGAAQTDDAGIAHAIAQFVRIELQRITAEGVRRGLVEPVGFDDHAGRAQAGWMRHRVFGNLDHRAGAGGVDRHAHIAARLRDHLAFEYAFAGFYQRLGRLADVLRKRQHQAFR